MDLGSSENDSQVNSEVEIKEETKIKNVLNFNSDQSNHTHSNSILRDKIINDDISSLNLEYKSRYKRRYEVYQWLSNPGITKEHILHVGW